jgi:hypothetical protein
MKRKLQTALAAIAFMALGHNVSAQTEVTYDFEPGLTGVVPTTGGGTPLAGVIASPALSDNGTPNTTKVLRQQTTAGLTNQTCVNDLTSIPTATDYSITWKEYITAIASLKKGFILRGTGSGTYAPGIKNGYYLMVQNNASGTVTFRIFNISATALTQIATSTPIYLDGGTTAMTINRAYWYRASVTGNVLKFEYSSDGTTFMTGYTYTDSSNLYPLGGVTQTACGIGGGYNQHYLDDVKFKSNDITTWNGTTWDKGLPVSSSSAIINGNYSEAANLVAGALEVKGTAVASIPTGYRCTVAGAVSVDPTASLTIENNANLIQAGTTNTNVGNLVVKRNSNPLYRLDYSMWSSPVSGTQTLANFSPMTSQSPSRFYIYDGITNNQFDNTLITPASAFASGTGYLIRMPNTDPTVGYDLGSATLSYPGVFTGKPNNGNVGLTSLTAGKYYSIGNPYPSTVSATSFLSGNPLAGGTLYFWRKTNNPNQGVTPTTSYATWTTAGGVANSGGGSAIVPNGTIQVGQGFIINTGTTTALNFTNAMRETAPTSTQILRTKQVADKDRIWLNMTTATGAFSQALVAYMDGATLGVDNGIDGLYFNDSPVALTSNIEGGEYTIQGRPAFDATDVVALNFKTDASGSYTIAIDHVDGVFAAGQDVYLVDSTTGTETNLKTDGYTFTAPAGTSNARFSLKFQKTLKVDAPAFNENSVAVYKNKGTLYVNSGVMSIATVKVYDIQGRLIAEQKKVKANTATINNLKATNQVLVVQVTSEDNKVVNKKVVN